MPIGIKVQARRRLPQEPATALLLPGKVMRHQPSVLGRRRA